jgi:hypothetical protein
MDPANGHRVRSAVTVIDSQTLQPTTVYLGDGAHGVRDVCLSPDGRYAFITHLSASYNLVASHLEEGWMNSNAVSVIDLHEPALLGHAVLDRQSQGAGNPWGIDFGADGKTLFVSHAGSHELSMFPLAPLLKHVEEGDGVRGPFGRTGALEPHLHRFTLPGNGPRDLAVTGSHVYVAEYFSDSLSVLDLPAAADREIRSVPLGPPPQLSEAARGEMYFHDARLCYQHWQSCASCHPDGRADGLNWDLLNDGAGNPRNTKSLLLAHQTPPAMVTGVRTSAEHAVRSGMQHILFSPPDERIARAMDVYLKSLRPVRSPHRVGDDLSPAARRGHQKFHSEVVGCARCHPPPHYTDGTLHAIGEADEHGRREYDTPTLIEVWRTSPYLRDGRYRTIEEMLIDGRHGLSDRVFEQLQRSDLEDLIEYVQSL